MKKFFQTIGMVSLICFSFIFTEKTALMVREKDELMITIKEQSENYKVESVDAIINGDVIIPGTCGKTVNEEKSYSNMKRLGEFNDKLIIYDGIIPNISINNMYDKYISAGNYRKNMVSLIFKVDKNNDIEKVIGSLKGEPANFFIDGKWLENNEKQLKSISSSNYNIGNMSYNGDYSNSAFVWLNTVIKKYSNQENYYCYLEEKNEDYLNICKLQKNYTILPTVVIKNNPLIEVKKAIHSGSIVSFEINDSLIKELPLIISYINSKGYKITVLDEHLSEDI